MAREITLRKDANKALETHHTSSEADASTSSLKVGKNVKNQGGGTSDATRAQVSLPSSGSSDKCKHCSNPGHITSLCPRKAAEKRGETRDCSLNSCGPVCNLCAALGTKDGSHKPRHQMLAAQDQYATGRDGRR